MNVGKTKRMLRWINKANEYLEPFNRNNYELCINVLCEVYGLEYEEKCHKLMKKIKKQLIDGR